MYLVTADAAVQRAAEESKVLYPVPDLQTLLQTATEAENPETIALIEEIIASGDFLEELREFISERIGWVGLVYSGDLAEGEVLEAVVLGPPEIQRFSVISASSETVGVILSARIPLEVTVEYEDRSSASYDKEDDKWYFAENETTEFEDDPLIKIFVSFPRADMSVREVEIITKDIHVSEPYDNYK
jgi:hypothetical protein